MNAGTIFWLVACVSCFTFGITIGMLLSTFEPGSAK